MNDIKYNRSKLDVMLNNDEFIFCESEKEAIGQSLAITVDFSKNTLSMVGAQSRDKIRHKNALQREIEESERFVEISSVKMEETNKGFTIKCKTTSNDKLYIATEI